MKTGVSTIFRGANIVAGVSSSEIEWTERNPMDIISLTITDTPVGIILPCCGEMHTVSWDTAGRIYLHNHMDQTEEEKAIKRAMVAMGKDAPVCYQIEADKGLAKPSRSTWEGVESYLSIHLIDYWNPKCALLKGTEFIRKGSEFDAVYSGYISA